MTDQNQQIGFLYESEVNIASFIFIPTLRLRREYVSEKMLS